MCLAQGHNTVTPMSLESAAHLPRVKHSTTEPLCSSIVHERLKVSIQYNEGPTLNPYPANDFLVPISVHIVCNIGHQRK